jgi:hypothetical protein
VQVPDEAFSETDQTVHLHMTEAGVIDNITFLGSGTDYANATIDITWKPYGKTRHYLPGSTNPLDPSDFAGAFRNAIATANFTVLLKGVTFTINGASSSGVFAEMGNERNGLFLDEQ